MSAVIKGFIVDVIVNPTAGYHESVELSICNHVDGEMYRVCCPLGSKLYDAWLYSAGIGFGDPITQPEKCLLNRDVFITLDRHGMPEPYSEE